MVWRGLGERVHLPWRSVEFGIWTDEMSYVLSPSSIVGGPRFVFKVGLFSTLLYILMAIGGLFW